MGSVAQVEFTWKYTNLTPFSECIPDDMDGNKRKYDGTNRTGKVTLQLYDDGWRIQR